MPQTNIQTKKLRREEFKKYLSDLFDVDPDNQMISILVDLSEDEDPKMKAKVVDLIAKRLPKKKASEKRVVSPVVEELLKLHMPHFLEESVEGKGENK